MKKALLAVFLLVGSRTAVAQDVAALTKVPVFTHVETNGLATPSLRVKEKVPSTNSSPYFLSVIIEEAKGGYDLFGRVDIESYTRSYGGARVGLDDVHVGFLSKGPFSFGLHVWSEYGVQISGMASENYLGGVSGRYDGFFPPVWKSKFWKDLVQ